MTGTNDMTQLEQRLAEQVALRRVQLGMTKIDVARAAGLTITTYSNIERGQSVRDASYGKVEPVLGWAPGSCSDILTGGTPTVIEKISAPGVVASPVSPGGLAADVERAVQDAAIAVTDGLSAAEIRALKRRVVEELRRLGRL